MRLLRKAREFDIDIIVYPSHCTHLLQGLDVVCFASLKQNWAEAIRLFEDENNRGVTKNDFARVFGTAYVKAFTPELVLKAWEATGIHPFNEEIIPPNKLAPSEKSSIKYTSNIVHSTPVRKVMEAFTFARSHPPGVVAMDTSNEGPAVQERG